jgi:hypothetical protein
VASTWSGDRWAARAKKNPSPNLAWTTHIRNRDSPLATIPISAPTSSSFRANSTCSGRGWEGTMMIDGHEGGYAKSWTGRLSPSSPPGCPIPAGPRCCSRERLRRHGFR